MSSFLAPGTISMGWNFLYEIFVDLGRSCLLGGISVKTGTEQERDRRLGDKEVVTGVEKDSIFRKGGISIVEMFCIERLRVSSSFFTSENLHIRFMFLSSLEGLL